MTYLTIEDTTNNTPLIQLQHIPGEDSVHRGNAILDKFEGNNPTGPVKDHPALSMVKRVEARGRIKPGDTLIEAASGNTGIVLAITAVVRGYKMVLIVPEDLSVGCRQGMAAYGAEIILTPVKGEMEYVRNLADAMEKEGRGVVLDQFANPDNPLAHYEITSPELWRDTEGCTTYFVSAMGTTGTIMGISRFLKEGNADIQIIGAQPEGGPYIPGIQKWPEAYMPKVYSPKYINRTESVSQPGVEHIARCTAREEDIFCGISAVGTLCVALRVAEEVENATIMPMVYDRGDRYSSMDVFPT